MNNDSSSLKERNSGIDFLKVIAMILIVLSHSVPKYGDLMTAGYIDFSRASGDFQNQLMLLFIYGGQLGNCIFIVCSSYLMLNSNSINVRKIINVILDSFVISIIYLIIIGLLGYEIPLKIIVKQILPITFENNWFVGCYLLFYALHPLIRHAVSDLSKREHAVLCMMCILFYVLTPLVLGDKYYYTKLVGFIIIYVFTIYVHKYWKDFENDPILNKLLLTLAVSMIVILIAVWNLMGQKVGFLNNRMLQFARFTNPLFIGIAYTLLNLLKKRKQYLRGGVFCEISMLSLLVYLIHNNWLFKNYCLVSFWEYVYLNFSYESVAAISIGLAMILFIFATALSFGYAKSLGKCTKYLSELFYKQINRAVDKFIF